MDKNFELDDIFDAAHSQLLPHSFRNPASSENKLAVSLEAVFDQLEIKDGQVLSFHHHYRNGDQLLNAVIRQAQAYGIKGLTLLASSIFPVHSPIISALKDGTIKHIISDYMSGPVADGVMEGLLVGKALLQSHGGRARAISAGQIEIDAAFIASPIATFDGATTGRQGKLACGPLGYPAVDAYYAKKTVVVAHEISSVPLEIVDIPAEFVDVVLQFDNPGRCDQIKSGSTIPAHTPSSEKISDLVVKVIEASGLLKNGISLQSGAGGYSLAAVSKIGQRMAEKSLTGSFLSGGIAASHARLLEAGVFKEIYDVQSFDLEAIISSRMNDKHHMMTAIDYASPLNPNARVNSLSVMLLGAVEVDLNFNVNVVCGSDGRILGGPGGHPDAAQGATLSIVTTSLVGGGYPKIVENVRCVVTPGNDIDVVITNHGIAVNPINTELNESLVKSGLPVLDIQSLRKTANSIATNKCAQLQKETGNLFVEHRDGGILDNL